MNAPLTLVSHHLCPYVQRAVIALSEKDVAFERVYVDLSDKPAWFVALSPLGKTPVLKVGETAIFESAVILEFLEETQPGPLHPADPLERAEHRSWIEFGSALLSDIWGFYATPDRCGFESKTTALSEKFSRLEARLQRRADGGDFFDDSRFSMVDTVYGPVFRYFDAFERIGDFGILDGKPAVAAWREALAARPSIRTAVAADYDERLWRFLEQRKSYLSGLIPRAA
jgi:glutathione S-transferase